MTFPGHGMKRRIVVGAVGLLIGLVCLALVGAYVDVEQARHSLATTRLPWLAAGLCCFWTSVGMRIVRWHHLMGHFASLERGQVGESLIVGYAMNYLLPARLGEPFRAEYVHRRFGVNRFPVFGSIVTERLLDGLSVVAILVAGLGATALVPDSADLSRLYFAAGTGLVVFGGIAALLFAARRLGARPLPGPRWLSRPAGRILEGASALPRRKVKGVLGWTAFIWSAEAVALWLLLFSLGVTATATQLMVLLGAAALIVPLPSAPGYVGTLQLVYVMVLSLLGLPAAMGAVAATLCQVVFFGSVIFAAGVIWTPRWFGSLIGASDS